MLRRKALGSVTAAASLAALAGQRTPAAGKKARPVLARESSTITTADGTNLFYRDWGVGRPVVFIAGWGFPSEMWNYQMAPISEKGLRCIAYDRRGHGRSSDPGRGYEYGTLADDLSSVLDALDLRGVTLVSHSMGAGEVVRYLTRHGGSRVARIALVAPTTLPFLTKTPDNPEGVDAGVFENFRRNFLLRDLPKWMEDNAGPFVVKETSPEMRAWLKGLAVQTSMKALVECQRASTSTDFRAELVKLRVPALIIQGDKDASGSVELTAGRAAGMIPGAQMKVYEGAPHGLFITHMDRLNADLLEFANQ